MMLWSRPITEIPVDVDDFPEVVALFGGEEVPHVLAIAMTLHVGNHTKNITHEGTWTEILVCPETFVGKKSTAEAFGVNILLSITVDNGTTVTAGIFETLTEIVVEVVLVRLAHVVVHLHLGIEGGEFLTLGSHAEDATDDHGAAGIDLGILTAEDFGEMLGHATTYAVVLLLTDVGEFTQSSLGGGIEAFQFLVGFKSEGREHVLLFGTAENTNDVQVVVVVDEPTGTMTPIVGHIEGFITFWSPGERCGRHLIRHVIGT